MQPLRPTVLALSLCSLTVLSSVADAGQNELTEAERRSGWKLLFDGKTTEGWRNYKKDSVGDGWKIVVNHQRIGPGRSSAHGIMWQDG